MIRSLPSRDDKRTLPSSIGLKECSKAIWEKVMEREETDYHEVAEGMLAEMRMQSTDNSAQFDERNVRRRVYDALNVLMAVGVIEKDKVARKIFWKGTADESDTSTATLERMVELERQRVAAKRLALKRLIQQKAVLRCLLQRNQILQQRGTSPFENSTTVQLPFALLTAPRDSTTYIHRTSSSDTAIICDKPLTMASHTEVLMRLGVADVCMADTVAATPSALASRPDIAERVLHAS